MPTGRVVKTVEGIPPGCYGDHIFADERIKPKVRVTKHAIARARQSVPAWQSKSDQSVRDRIANEVVEAIFAYRMAKREPVSWGPDRRYARQGSPKNHPIRYVWTEDERHAYIVKRTPMTVTVITCVTKDRADARKYEQGRIESLYGVAGGPLVDVYIKREWQNGEAA